MFKLYYRVIIFFFAISYYINKIHNEERMVIIKHKLNLEVIAKPIKKLPQ